jgi:hypothetical protein
MTSGMNMSNMPIYSKQTLGSQTLDVTSFFRIHTSRASFSLFLENMSEILIQTQALREQVQYHTTKHQSGTRVFSGFTEKCQQACIAILDEVNRRYGRKKDKFEWIAIEWTEERVDPDGDPSVAPTFLSPFCVISASPKDIERVWRQRGMSEWTVRLRRVKGESIFGVL